MQDNSDHSEDRTLGVVKSLIRLYAHQSNAIKDLESQARINPDFTSHFRNDLEFYVPQICTFYLTGEMEHPEELYNLILLASSTDFFFSHRVWFHYQSSLQKGLAGADRRAIERVLHGLMSSCMSAQGNLSEPLYLANSQDIIRLLVDLNLGDFYPSLCMVADPSFQRFLEASGRVAAAKSQHDPNYRMRLELDKDDQRERIQRARLIINEYNQHALDELELGWEANGRDNSRELPEKNFSSARRTATSLS